MGALLLGGPHSSGPAWKQGCGMGQGSQKSCRIGDTEAITQPIFWIKEL